MPQDHIRRPKPVKSSPSTDQGAGKQEAWFVRAFTDSFLDVRSNDLSDRAFRVLLVLDGRAATDPFCFPGNQWLRERTGKSDSTLAEIFLELEGKGWLRRVFTEAHKRERIGFIFLRRIDPAITPSAEDTPEGIARARAAMMAKMASLVSGNPDTRASVSPGFRTPRLRKSGDTVPGNPESHVSGNPAPYIDPVVIVRPREEDSGIKTGGGGSISVNDNDQRPGSTPRRQTPPPPGGYHTVSPESRRSLEDARRRAREAREATTGMTSRQASELCEVIDALTPAAEPIEPPPRVAAAVERAMVDVRQAASMAHEPINADVLTEGEHLVLERLDPDRRARLEAMDPIRQGEILEPHRRGFDAMRFKVTCRLLDPPPMAKIRHDATTEDLIGMLASGDPAAVASAAEALCRDFGSEKDRQLWPAFRKLTEQVWRGEVSAEHVLDARRQGLNPRARNPGAVFCKALKNHGWKP